MPQLNTTSTADISFILLVFFLIMTSMDADKGLLSLAITADNRLMADGKPLGLGDARRRVMSFVAHSADRSNHIIALEVDRQASYDVYFSLQNEIVAAYNELRNGYAVRKYGRPYAQCTPEQRAEVRDYYPQRITETSAGAGEGGGR